MDDPTLSLVNIFRALSFDFANEDIAIELPDNATDIQGIDNLDPNDKSRMLIDRDRIFFQTLYTTTMTEYKALLHMWHKGTGGGPGLDIYFESWSQDKKDKYNIDLDSYDHSNVAGRPAILIENYTQDHVKKPYLAVIHMWDELTAHLLSSKHDPFESTQGEIGIS